jgi:hypothetical protein
MDMQLCFYTRQHGMARMIIILGLTVGTLVPAEAQRSSPDVGAILTRLGIPTSTLDEVAPAALDLVCQGTNCSINLTTLSDQTCRAVAVDVALRRRAEQLRAGGSAQVVTRVQCSQGVFAVFQTSARRGVIGHRDSAGNTSQREFPM